MTTMRLLSFMALTALLGGLLLSISSPARAAPRMATAPAATQHVFTAILAALKNDDYPAFIADGDATFKGSFTKATLDQASAQMAPRLKAGYQALYLTELNQKGFQVYLWKLTYADGGDDALVSLLLKAGKVGGFSISLG